jgi:hypothetical protein
MSGELAAEVVVWAGGKFVVGWKICALNSVVFG